MKKDMNLLPWRIKQLRQKNRRLLVTLFIGATLCTISTLLLTHFAESYTDNAGKAQLQYTTYQQELQVTQQQIQQFRHSHAQLEISPHNRYFTKLIWWNLNHKRKNYISNLM